jgi:hypothetical protein
MGEPDRNRTAIIVRHARARHAYAYRVPATKNSSKEGVLPGCWATSIRLLPFEPIGLRSALGSCNSNTAR